MPKVKIGKKTVKMPYPKDMMDSVEKGTVVVVKMMSKPMKKMDKKMAMKKKMKK